VSERRLRSLSLNNSAAGAFGEDPRPTHTFAGVWTVQMAEPHFMQPRSIPSAPHPKFSPVFCARFTSLSPLHLHPLSRISPHHTALSLLTARHTWFNPGSKSRDLLWFWPSIPLTQTPLDSSGTAFKAA
jgi:hypothetical protein